MALIKPGRQSRQKGLTHPSSCNQGWRQHSSRAFVKPLKGQAIASDRSVASVPAMPSGIWRPPTLTKESNLKPSHAKKMSNDTREIAQGSSSEIRRIATTILERRNTRLNQVPVEHTPEPAGESGRHHQRPFTVTASPGQPRLTIPPSRKPTFHTDYPLSPLMSPAIIRVYPPSSENLPGCAYALFLAF